MQNNVNIQILGNLKAWALDHLEIVSEELNFTILQYLTILNNNAQYCKN